MKKITATIIILIMGMFILNLYSVQASLGKVEQNSCASIRVLANCSQVNLTEVTRGGITYEINSEMTKIGGQTFNYSFCNTSQLGVYTYSWDNPCVDCSQGDCGNSFEVTYNGEEFETKNAIVYLFFLIICLILTFLSIRLIKNNSERKEEISDRQKYEMHKVHELKYYLHILKSKLWIVGLFGVYLSIFVFIGFLNQLTYILGLSELTELLIQINIIIGWGFIPFTLFWIGYIIIFLYKSTENILRYQFGGFKE